MDLSLASMWVWARWGALCSVVHCIEGVTSARKVDLGILFFSSAASLQNQPQTKNLNSSFFPVMLLSLLRRLQNTYYNFPNHFPFCGHPPNTVHHTPHHTPTGPHTLANINP